MKKIIVTALMVTLLLTGIGTTASAADTCQHTWKEKEYEGMWVSTNQGYSHGYSTNDGVVCCNVTKMRYYKRHDCTKCSVIEFYPTENYWESHSKTDHNLPKPVIP